MDERTRIEIVAQAPVEAVIELYMDAGWWEEGWKEEVIPAMIANSFLFAAVYRDGEMIGMGRAISDGVSDAYIQDVVVRSDHRGQGLGQAIVKRLVKELQKAGVDWIGLIGQPGTKDFYEKIGFGEMPQFVPMKYQC